MRGHRQLGVELDLALLQPLEQQIEGHDLGERSGMARSVGIGRLHDRAGIDVDDDRGIGGLVAFAPGCAEYAGGARLHCRRRRPTQQQAAQAQGAPTQAAIGQKLPHAALRSPQPRFRCVPGGP